MLMLAALLGAAGPAVAQAPSPPAGDEHGEIELARELAQICGQASYFPQHLLDQAARLRYPGSAEEKQVTREAAAASAAQGSLADRERAVRNRLRLDRIARARAIGCGESAAPVLTRGRDFLNVELAAMLKALDIRMQAYGDRLSEEEMALAGAAQANLQQVYQQDIGEVFRLGGALAQIRETAASGRFDPQTPFARFMSVDSPERVGLFAALRFQTVAAAAGWTPQVRYLGYRAGEGPGMSRVIELTRRSDSKGPTSSPTARVVGGTSALAVKASADSPPIRADAVLIREADGSLTLALYGDKEVERLRSAGLTLDLSWQWDKRASSVPMPARECGFAICLRLPSDTDARMAADPAWQTVVGKLRAAASGNDPKRDIRIDFTRAEWERARGNAS
jgi:hypothetical protein